MSQDDGQQATVGQYTSEMQAVMDGLAASTTEVVDFTRPPDAASRALNERINAILNVDLPLVANVRHLRIAGDASLGAADCNAVVYEPAGASEGIVFFIHGGGWSYNSPATYDRFMRVLCNEACKTVVGVDYRLAPEHPFPAALHDVVSAFRAILSSRAQMGLPAGPVVIAGDSAGGNLAMAAMLHELGAARELPVGALLFYGVMGRDFETPSYNLYAEGHLLTKPIMQQLWAWYDPQESAKDNPLAVPLRASDEQLRALPPLFLLAAEMDPLASDTIDLKARLDRLGRNDAFWLERGVIHGYVQMTAMLEAARRSTLEAAKAANRFISDASSCQQKNPTRRGAE